MNLSGIGINKVYRSGVKPGSPYYYITGSLDLTGAVEGGTYFFNFDNDFTYASSRDYANFIIVDENMIISEVIVYTDPEIDTVDGTTYLAIGGADYSDPIDNSVKVWWAAPPAYGPFCLASALIDSASRNGSSVCTINTESPHYLSSGQKVTVTASASILNATNTAVTVVDDNTFTYTNTSVNRTITTVVRATGTATVTTSSPHGLLNGQVVNISGVTDASFNATGVTIGSVGASTFTYTNAGVNASSSGGTVTPTLALSSSITGTVVGTGGPFFNGYPLTETEINDGPISYYGHEGGHYPYFKVPGTGPYTSNTSKRYKYLAVTVLGALPPLALEAQSSSAIEEGDEIIVFEDSEEVQSPPEAQSSTSREIKSGSSSRQRKLLYRGLPTGTKAINSGRITVTLKVYPKTQ